MWKKRESDSDIQQQEQLLRDLLREQKRTPEIDIRHKIDTARVALNISLTTKAEKSIRWSGNRYYTLGDKPHTLLAHKLSPRQFSSALPKLKLRSGQQSQNPRLIVNKFFSFYTRLYSQPQPLRLPLVAEYFRDLPLPTLSSTHKDIMEREFTEAEVLAAIKTLNLTKAPGPDGFSGHYYKKYKDLLSPHLCTYFNSISKGIPIPKFENNAFIHVIPKPGKDQGDCLNYRPIYLINLDLKLMAKILATILNTFITNYIHPDQTGFVPQRQTTDQTRRAINIISALRSDWDGETEGYVVIFRHAQSI